MKILGIETSCDDCSAGVIIDGCIYSNVVQTQIIHKQFGGVVPEIASREHIKTIELVVHKALSDAGFSIDDIDVVSSTYGPGLIGSLLVGYTFSKSLAYKNKKDFFPANHILSHLFSPFINKGFVEKKFLGLVISGGHTKLFRVNNMNVELIGDTLDDACGEVFDKVAKMLGIGYPGGMEIEKWSKFGDPEYFKFPIPKVKGLDFSFSGLKTSVLYTYNKLSTKDKIERIRDISASFMKTVVDYVVLKLREASRKTGIKRIALSGGVSANIYLQEKIKENFDIFYFPDKGLSSDNGAMVGFLAYLFYSKDLKKDYFKKKAEAITNFYLRGE